MSDDIPHVKLMASVDGIDAFARMLRGDMSMMKCTICAAQAGTCDCWTKCAVPGCAWSFQKGTACRNPAHGQS